MNQIPEPIKVVLRPVYKTIQLIIFKGLDYYDIIKGDKNPLIPPRSMIFIGDGDYKNAGEEFFTYFIEFGGLKPDAKVLDVGCGIGRMAVPLTKYLNKGEYYGFDIVKKGIDWCNKNITKKYPNFHFEHSNVFNKMYNPKGFEHSSEFVFKYNSQFFDFVFLTSVFTHMYTSDISNYLQEIARVMKKGARCLITMFILNEESNKLIEMGSSTQNLIYKIDDISFTKDIEVPESAMGFNERFIMELFKKNSLMIKGSIQYGSWCGRQKFKSYQDIIVAEKL